MSFALPSPARIQIRSQVPVSIYPQKQTSMIDQIPETTGADGIGYGVPFRQKRHIAFLAGSRARVESLHAALLASGGIEHGSPGLPTAASGASSAYPKGYYAAFVLSVFREPGRYR